MCGIAGYFGSGDSKILTEMLRAIDYRGPDDEGFYVTPKLGLGQRRLSIIDLSPSGHQPMSNEDGKIWLIFNGEIYNYKQFRQELESLGHKFKSQTDTEVIIHLYEEYGQDILTKLNGMFALALWDERKEFLLLARDKFGQKPLYYFFNNDSLIFASEIKSILKHPSVKKEIDELSVYQYFSFDYVPQPRTIIKNVKKLENGQLLIYRNGKIELKYYYKVNLSEKKISEEEAVDKLDKLLSKAIKSHLVADVPLGIFLSGGIDSSSMAYYAKQEKNDIKTFSIGFADKSYDETSHARVVANHLKTEHYHKQFSNKELIDIIPKVFSKLDEPFGDVSILACFLLSEFTHRKVKVALSGDGGDELFCGYPNHKVQKFLGRLKIENLKLNSDWPKLIIKLLPVSDKNMSLSFILQRILMSSQFEGRFRDFIVIGAYNESLVKLFKFNKNKQDLFLFTDKFLAGYNNYNYFDKIVLLFFKYYLGDDMMFKSDRASMYNSLEVREPFLDANLSDFVNSLPASYKIRGLKTKYILKKLMMDKLPAEIINRKKKGFGVPIGSWLKSDLKGYMQETLSKKNVDKIGFLNYKIVDKLVSDHLHKKSDNRKILWNLIIFVNWYMNFINEQK